MKNKKLFLSAIIIIPIVGSALALKSKSFGQGSVYCETSTTACCNPNSKIDFRVDPINGTITDPCETGHAYICTSGNICMEVPNGTKFSATAQ